MNWYLIVGFFNLILYVPWLYRSLVEQIENSDMIDWYIGIFGTLVLGLCIVIFWPLLVIARLLKLTYELVHSDG